MISPFNNTNPVLSRTVYYLLKKTLMAILSVFILNKAGGLIYHSDRYSSKSDVEKTFSYPLDIVLKEDDKLTVVFGERDGIKGAVNMQLFNCYFIKIFPV